MIAVLTTIVGVAALLNTCHADLFSDARQMWTLSSQQGGPALTTWLLEGDEPSTTEPFGAVITKFLVPPGKASKFVSAWKDIEHPTRNESGNFVFDLKKVATDNLLFYEYAEYSNKSAYLQHLFSPYIKNFIKTIAELNIYSELIPTINIKTEQGPEFISDGNPQVALALDKKHHKKAREGDVDFRDKPFFVVIDYLVPPSESLAFIRAFKEFQVKVSEEQGLKMHALHKTLTDNLTYKVYGVWETLQDYWNHLASGHMKCLLEFNAQRGIVFDLKPLIKIGDEPEAIYA